MKPEIILKRLSIFIIFVTILGFLISYHYSHFFFTEQLLEVKQSTAKFSAYFSSPYSDSNQPVSFQAVVFLTIKNVSKEVIEILAFELELKNKETQIKRYQSTAIPMQNLIIARYQKEKIQYRHVLLTDKIQLTPVIRLNSGDSTEGYVVFSDLPEITAPPITGILYILTTRGRISVPVKLHEPSAKH